MDNISNALATISNLIGWLFGLLALFIGAVNTFWGNDPGFGVFIIVLSFAFLPPVNAFLKEKPGFSISRIVKWLLGFFILWASLGVGELFDKINLMMASF